MLVVDILIVGRIGWLLRVVEGIGIVWLLLAQTLVGLNLLSLEDDGSEHNWLTVSFLSCRRVVPVAYHKLQEPLIRFGAGKPRSDV